MQDGRDRSDVDYIWPMKIVRPKGLGKLVYLDLNHWIELAKAKTGHVSEGQSVDLLNACVRARNELKAVFPISDSIYFELTKISSRQRRHLRETIEEVSGLSAILPIVTVVKHEVEEALDQRVGPSSIPLEVVPYVGNGWTFALGSGEYADAMSQIKEREVGRIARVDVELAASFGRFFDRMQAAEERSILDGPRSELAIDELIPHLNTESISEVMEARLRQELSLRDFLNTNPNIRKNRVRDFVMNRSVKDDILGLIYSGLLDRKAEFSEVLGTLDECRELFDSMPSCDVMITIRTMYHRNPEHPWSINDIYDTDALCSAVPYCDFVLTDKAVATQVEVSGLAARLGTAVSYRGVDLLEFLAQPSA